MDFINQLIDEHLNAIAIIVTIVTAIVSTVSVPIIHILRLRRWRNDKVRQLDDLYGNGNEAIRFFDSGYYIPVSYQTTKPHDVYKDDLNKSQDNNSSLDNSERGLLVQKILFDILKSNIKKRYMILGGSGMGKSTFSASLYISILNHYKLRKCPFPFYLCSLFDSDIFTRLNQIKSEIIQSGQKINDAVLILDGLDENCDATEDYKTFLSNIEAATKSFRVVVITSRTQLFPDEDHEPTKTRIMFTAGDGNVIKYEKYYISPFTNDETKKYLEYKYKNEPEKYNRAIKLLDKSNDLVSRPMVLDSIDKLLPLSEKNGLSLVEVYLAIVDYWRERDNHVKNMDSYKYYTFTKKISSLIYDNYHKQGNQENELSVSKDDFECFFDENYNGDNPYSFRVRSLLNRTNYGRIKFSHRSFYELFLAINAIERPDYSYKIDDEKTSLVPAFFADIYFHYRQKKELPHIIYRYSDYINIHENFTNNKVKEFFMKAKDAIYETSNANNSRVQLYYFYHAIVSRLSNHVHYTFLLYDVCEKAISVRMADQVNTIEELLTKEIESEYIPVIRQKAENFKKASYNHIISFIIDIQNVFYYQDSTFSNFFDLIDKDYKQVISDIKKYHDILTILKNYKVLVAEFEYPCSDIEPIFYPEIMELDSTFLSSYLTSTDEFYIGCGFNDDDKVFDLIKKVKQKMISRIYIFRESNDINIHTRFISLLSNYCIDNNDVFILVITIEEKRIFYVVTNHSKLLSEDSIKTCLLNMIEANR